MLKFIGENIATILVGAVVLGALLLSLRHMAKQKKKGGCAGGCGGCPNAGNCGKAQGR